MTVLLVEDEQMVAVLLEDMVTSLGCETAMVAHNVRDALNAISLTPPDLAVLDVSLGEELVYPVAEKLGSLRVPFIFTTGFGRSAITLEWAARPVVQKPFNIAALEAALKTALQSKTA
jgi:DNA-binding response OmpR family regulator